MLFTWLEKGEEYTHGEREREIECKRERGNMHKVYSKYIHSHTNTHNKCEMQLRFLLIAMKWDKESSE